MEFAGHTAGGARLAGPDTGPNKRLRKKFKCSRRNFAINFVILQLHLTATGT